MSEGKEIKDEVTGGKGTTERKERLRREGREGKGNHERRRGGIEAGDRREGETTKET